MRIIAGMYRGKKLFSPEDEKTRPTSDRARESLFNILTHMLTSRNKKWDEIVFGDVFAGTGAVGLEAFSRGASKIFFFEIHPAAMQVLKRNIAECAGASQKSILSGDALTPPMSSKVDILFMDAPYGKNLWEKALPEFQKKKWIDSETIIVIETDKSFSSVPPGFQIIQERHYGKNTFLFLKAI